MTACCLSRPPVHRGKAVWLVCVCQTRDAGSFQHEPLTCLAHRRFRVLQRRPPSQSWTSQTSPPQRDRQEQVATGSLRECQLWAGPTWEASLVTCVTVYGSRYPPGKVPGDGNAGWHRARSERRKTGAQAPARPPPPCLGGVLLQPPSMRGTGRASLGLRVALPPNPCLCLSLPGM